MKRKIPLWILIITTLFALMELAGAFVIYLMPQDMFEDVDFTGKGTFFLAQSWATRQFALGVLMVFALIKKSKQLIIGSYLFLVLAFLGDALVAYSQNQPETIMAGIVMALITGLMLFFTSRLKDEN